MKKKILIGLISVLFVFSGNLVTAGGETAEEDAAKSPVFDADTGTTGIQKTPGWNIRTTSKP